jgi:hypothetical protein
MAPLCWIGIHTHTRDWQTNIGKPGYRMHREAQELSFRPGGRANSLRLLAMLSSFGPPLSAYY